jgi:hypothetical protein
MSVFDLGSKWSPCKLEQLARIHLSPRQVYVLDWRDEHAFSLSIYQANGVDGPSKVTVARKFMGSFFTSVNAQPVIPHRVSAHYFGEVDGERINLRTSLKDTIGP